MDVSARRFGSEAPPDRAGSDRQYVARLSAERPEPDPDGDPPTDDDWALILDTAVSVPDHGDLRPWRFAVCSGPGRVRFSEALAAGLLAMRGPDVPEAAVTKMRGKAFAAPAQVVLIAAPDLASNVERWEQVASASCTGYAVVLASIGLGYGAVWKSAHVLESAPVRELFGLASHESLLGWVNVGTAAQKPKRSAAGRGDPLDGRVLRIDG